MSKKTMGTFLLIMLLNTILSGPLQAEEFVYSSCRGNNWNLWIYNSEKQTTEQLTDSADIEEFEPRWFAGGKKVIYADNLGHISIIDRGTGEVKKLPLPNGRYNQPQVRPTQEDIIIFSSLITVPTDQSDIEMVGYNKGKISGISKLIARKGMENFATISPNGKRVAYSYWPSNKPRSDYFGITEEIWLRNLTAHTDQQLTILKADSYGSAWSPKGNRLAFSSNKNGQYDIWLYNFASKETSLLVSSPGKDSHPVWSADGDYIYFTSSRTGRPQIHSFQLNGGNTARVTDDPCGIRSFDVR